MDASQRGNLLYKVADLIERDLDYLAVSEIMLIFSLSYFGRKELVACYWCTILSHHESFNI